ncbi:hypothetical protein CO230_05380 [Chryseobacterium sp. 6424]|uniref:DUF6175 family protein n=1 Tax=Chryseobacterium sp. 6424 TaxID=2039166 RepID=UPI000EFBB447|nr:DUF6175 family protein [Chryseobacterium sp. 6424]AYO57602.1 hypothetical protein CO230_05380 [Chryseobacterium sp. 6424]
MKNFFLRNILPLALALVSLPGFAQMSASNVQTVQPKIMVIPYVKEGEDLRNILENDVNKRIALTKIKEVFDSRGFTTVDFIAKLKSAKDNNIFTSDNQTDLKDQIVQMSGADIYVQAEVTESRTSSGNSVSVVMSGYEASTGNSLSNKVGESGKFYTDDFGKLASKAVESVSQEFLNVMQTKFTDIVTNGKSINIDISFAQGSVYKMSSVIAPENLPLSDQIEMWMENNAYKNNYHIQGTTDMRMILDDVKIPLKDSNGKNYNPNKFALEMFKFFRNINLQTDKDIKGNTIYITIK